MKKIFISMIIALFSANLLASTPTVADLSEKYEVSNKVVFCIQFIEEAEVCNDVRFVGTPNGWGKGLDAPEGATESWDNCEKFAPVTGFEGWYVAELPYSEGFEGKPLQEPSDRAWTWDYQCGDADAWVHVDGGELEITPGYADECNIKASAPGVYIYQLKYWKKHKNPCDYILRHYTVSLYIPDACPNMKPAIIGGFNKWSEGIAMNEGVDSNLKTVYTYSFNDINEHVFQIKEASDTHWTNRMQYYDEVNDQWKDMGNYVLGEDTNIVLNWSDNDFYRFSICGGDRPVVIAAKLPTKNCPDNIEIIGSFDGWAGSAMTFNTNTGYYETTISTSALDEFKFRQAGDWTNQIMYYDSIINQWKYLDGNYRLAFKDFWNGSANTIVMDLGNGDKYKWSLAEIIDGSPQNEGYILGVGKLSIYEQYQLTAIPNPGYQFVQWSDSVTDNPRTIILTQDTTFTAEFAKNTYSITTASSNPEWGITTGDTAALYLEEVEIFAIPNNGYHFVHWNDYNTSNPRIISVKENKTYTAIFAQNTYYITQNAEHGYISGNSSAKYLDYVTLTAIPDYGYHFVRWDDGVTDNPRSFVITKDTTVTAEFAIDRTGACGENNTLTWSYDPSEKALTITGSDALSCNYTYGVEAPNSMEKLIITDGITAIGANAFENMSTIVMLQLPASLKTIGDKAFENCINMTYIYNYRERPCLVSTTTFDGVNKFDCALYVLANSVDMYKSAGSNWKDFYFILPIGTTEVTEPISEVVTEPTESAVVLTWPISDNAASYTIEITKDGEVFCRLIFNGNGQLTGNAFAPGRNGSHHAPAAVMTANGLQFTVTGLNSNTQYGYSVTAKDSNNQPVATYLGEFTTIGVTATGIDNIQRNNTQCTKELLNGQIFILRGDKTYTMQGQEVK